MDFRSLVAALPGKKASVYTFDRGKTVRHPHAAHVAFLDAHNSDVHAQERPPSGDADEADQHSLVFSSGSAGGLKGLVISRKGVEETIPPVIEALQMRSSDRLLLFLPMSNFQ